MFISGTGIGDPEPLVVKPKVAWKMLGCGNTHGYELLELGELDSYLDGRSRKITVESLHRLIARRLAAAKSSKSPAQGSPPASSGKDATDWSGNNHSAALAQVHPTLSGAAERSPKPNLRIHSTTNRPLHRQRGQKSSAQGVHGPG
jgi:hypothetical protein